MHCTISLLYFGEKMQCKKMICQYCQYCQFGGSLISPQDRLSKEIKETDKTDKTDCANFYYLSICFIGLLSIGLRLSGWSEASGITTENRFSCLFYCLLEIPEFSNISSTYCFCSFALSAFLLLGFVAIVSKYFLAK